MDQELRRYDAIFWVKGSDDPKKEVFVMAKGLQHARELLEREYGEGNIFYLRNKEDAGRAR
jgi:hypothetical protein